MATYASYKKIPTDGISDGAILNSHLLPCTRKQFSVFWVFGSPAPCSSGCCCLWTVPDFVTTIRFELWGAGGGGPGVCVCNRCQHYAGGGGGSYNSKTISTTSGCQYTICAAGVFPCFTTECCGCLGCASYVNGYNLTNFCAIGGAAGLANDAWTTSCYSELPCVLSPGCNGGDFGWMGHSWGFGASEHNYAIGHCHCYVSSTQSLGAPLIGTQASQGINYCWFRCGCWHVPYGQGGQAAMTTFCGDGCQCLTQVCATGGTGGAGLVKITYF